MSEEIRKYIDRIKQYHNAPNLKSFNLTDKEIYEAAIWIVYNMPIQMYVDDGEKIAIKKTMNDIVLLIQKSNFPEGFKNTPSIIPIYRIIELENVNELDKNNLGVFWFTDLKYEKDIIYNLGSERENLYRLTSEVSINDVDVLSSIAARLNAFHENELTLKTDKSLKLNSIIPIKI